MLKIIQKYQEIIVYVKKVVKLNFSSQQRMKETLTVMLHIIYYWKVKILQNYKLYNTKTL